MIELAPGETREVISDADPRGDYRLTVSRGRISFAKSKHEAARGHGETVDKFNRVRYTVGEDSESVWVHNAGERAAQFSVTKSGFFAEYFPSSTQETATENAERNGRVFSVTTKTQVVPHTDQTGLESHVVSDILSRHDMGDADGVVLSGLNVKVYGEVADPQNLRFNAVVMRDRLGDAERIWEAQVTPEDRVIQLPDGGRPFLPHTEETWELYVDLLNSSSYRGEVSLDAIFRGVE